MWNNFIQFISNGENVVFFVFSIMTIAGAVYMLSFSKVVHMVISVAFTFLSLAGLYVLLQAEFVAFVQVLIYAGAISILMIFGIMMTKHEEEDKAPQRTLHNALLIIGVLGFFGILVYAIQTSAFPIGKELNAGADNTRAIGEQLFTRYVIPFELMSVLLTVAFIGAIILAKKEEGE
jgi:NADH-quinone oxidoreductase subunit J